MWIFALKEFLELYNRRNGTLYSCFIDTSKMSNHENMFYKLIKKSIKLFGKHSAIMLDPVLEQLLNKNFNLSEVSFFFECVHTVYSICGLYFDI